eukprot:3600676-Amphidinium_carterae.1
MKLLKGPSFDYTSQVLHVTAPQLAQARLAPLLAQPRLKEELLHVVFRGVEHGPHEVGAT